MNTREYLIHRLQQGLRGRNPEAIADLILNGHAHELAEEIRDFAARRLQIDSDDETYGMHMAADLIDPEVKK